MKLIFEYCGTEEDELTIAVNGDTRDDCFNALDKEFEKLGYLPLCDEDHIFYEAYESAQRGEMRHERRDFSSPESNYNLIWRL